MEFGISLAIMFRTDFFVFMDKTVEKMIPEIVTQHAEEAAFLWLLRAAAVRAPHYNLADVADLDERVEAHLDGLRVAGEAGWELCVEQLAHEEAGEVFAAAVLALESKNIKRLERVLAVAEAVPETVRGFISALGWVTPQTLRGTGKMFLNGGTPFVRRLGIAACALHGADPGEMLATALDDDDAALRARALRAAGELGRVDLLPALRKRLDAAGEEDPACRYWAAWSAVLLGERGPALEHLRVEIISGSPFAGRALQLVPRVLDRATARAWLKGLVVDPDWLRPVIQAIGAHGDSFYVPWLIKQMANPKVARVAGEAFAMICGVDIAYQDLDGDEPAGFEAGPTENPEDEDVAMDADEDLPWPDPAKLEPWWEENKGRLAAGTRYLVGAPVSPERCREVLATGFQRQRNGAALELALSAPGEPLFATRAPGHRQRQLLARTGQAA